MVTWTFDLTALVVGLLIGTILGGLGSMGAMFREGGAWSKGFDDGFGLKCWLKNNGKYPEPPKETKKED